MQPFIIWTLQRTGGTNFAKSIIGHSGLPSTEHEPLNLGRAYGNITHSWNVNRDLIELRFALKTFLKNGFAIKHCVETVDATISIELARECYTQGYGNIFLYREKRIDRLMSLYFAEKTGLWGRRKVNDAKAIRGSDFYKISDLEEVDAERLVDHEKRCQTLLTSVMNELASLGTRFSVISFEEIYDADRETAFNKVHKLLKDIGYDTSIVTPSFVDDILGEGDQGSKSLYADIRGYSELKQALSLFPSMREYLIKNFPDDVK